MLTTCFLENSSLIILLQYLSCSDNGFFLPRAYKITKYNILYKEWLLNKKKKERKKEMTTNFPPPIHMAPVVQKLDSAIHQINHYRTDKC